MEAPSVAISPLGFDLDLMWHGVLMRIRWRSTAWSDGARSGLAGVGTGRAGARERRSQDRYDARERERERESDSSEIERDARTKTKGNGVNPAPGRPIYRGSTESIRCGSFHRTMRLNGSIPRTSREDPGGFFATT
jgi:hypothetical protein